MDTILTLTCEHAHSAYWIIFLLLMLAGLNIPISEDILLLVGGAIGSTFLPHSTWHLFFWILAGCWISAWEAYWIGRYFGPHLYKFRWTRWLINPEKIQKLHGYYEKFGIITFIVGRFCPGGVRNALFMTAGLGKMPFLTFILRDGFAAMLSVPTIFFIGYTFGQNHKTILAYFQTLNYIALVCVALGVVGGVAYFWKRSEIKPLA